ncbi:DUF2784 family protein [bacterium]|nr:DUF2784 family protein [bacterium]
MSARLLADVVLVVHLLFILFVVLGGLVVLRWPRLAWLHLPCWVWGALIEFTGWICPLTPLEVRLRHEAGQAGYSGGFIDHYLVPLVYPPGLTPQWQIVLGVGVLAINGVIYGLLVRRLWRRRTTAVGR